jgi:hypothetical protein
MMKKTIVTLVALAFVLFVPGASALSIEDAVPPDAKVGQAYFFQLHARQGSGTPPLKWVVPHSGVFPPGLSTVVSNDTRTLTILGVPTKEGIYNFFVQMIDSPGPWVCCTEKPFTIRVGPTITPPKPGEEPNLTDQQFPYTGPYYGPDYPRDKFIKNKGKGKGNTAQALKLVMHQLDLGFFPNPDKIYNRALVTAMVRFQMARGIIPTGNYGKESWRAVQQAHKPDGKLAAGQVARVLVNLEYDATH